MMYGISHDKDVYIRIGPQCIMDGIIGSASYIHHIIVHGNINKSRNSDWEY